MSFHWPHAFWFLLIPLALLASGWRRRRVAAAVEHPKILRAEASGHALRLSAQPTLLSTRTRPRLRLCLGLALAIVALARPQWGRLEEPVFDQAREILIAIDLSRSMLAPDVKPSRLDRAKLLITSLLERLQGERVGLVVFAGTAFLQSPLSADYEILREFLPALTPDFLPQGGSNYQALLDAAVSAFGESNAADRFLIVLSDGEATDEAWKKLTGDLKTKNIRVLGLGIGTAEGAMLPDGSGGFVKDERGAVVLSKLEPRTLQELADATNGVYVDASGWVDLAQLLQSTVEAGRKGDFQETNRARLAERFQWALAPALLLLLWSFWREFPVRPKVRDVQWETPPTPPPLPPQESASAARTATSAAAVALMTFLSCPPSHLLAQAAPEGTAAAEPLSKLVSQFSTRDALVARDYAELARTTLTYGERTQAAQQPVPEGPIRDGLAAVDAGRALDPDAADWAKLRADLEKLLEKPEQQKQQDQKNRQDKNDQQKKPEDQKKSDQDKSSDDASQDKNSSEQQKQSEQNERKNAEKKDSEQKSSEEKKDDQKSGSDGKPGEEDKNKPKPQSAFGDMDKPDEKKTPPPPGETQKVGGAQEKKAPPPNNPALTVPLQKLEQVRDQDSPARLFQLMQDPNAKPEKPPGKNW